jgi:hypothetical protein
MFPAGFETVVPESERPQTHVLDRAESGIGAFNVPILKVR